MAPEESPLITFVKLGKWLTYREIQGLIMTVTKALAGSL